MPQQYASQQPADFQNHIENVAIVGATGTVGKFIVESLLATRKHTVTAITRKESKSQIPDGLRKATIDYDNPRTIVDALKGQDMLIITLAVSAPKITQAALIDAAAEAGVKWIMPNEYSPDFATQPEFGQKSLLGGPLIETRKHIADKGMSYVGLSSGFWYQYSLIFGPETYGFDIKNKTVTYVDNGEALMSTSTWPQSGRAVAAALSLPILPEKPGDEGKGPYLDEMRSGAIFCHSFRLSQKDILASILRVTGDNETDWKIESESAQARWERGMAEMKAGNRKGFAIALYAPTFFGDGAGDLTARSHNKALGLPEEDLDEATKDALEMFASGWSYY